MTALIDRRFGFGKMAASRSYLCGYGFDEINREAYCHIIDRETGAITSITEKINRFSTTGLPFFSNSDEACFALNPREMEAFPIRKVKNFGFGAVEEVLFSSDSRSKVYGYSRTGNTVVSANISRSGKFGDMVNQHNFDDQTLRNSVSTPVMDFPIREFAKVVEVNQYGEIAILILVYVEERGPLPFYARVDILTEEGNELVHTETLYISDNLEFHVPIDLAVDLDGSFLVITEDRDPYERDHSKPIRCTVHRCKRHNTHVWNLEKLNSFSMENARFSALDLFVAGGFVFVSGVTDRGIRKPHPIDPDRSYERYPLMHSFHRSDGRSTDLESIDFHSSEDEEWTVADAFADNDFIYFHGFIHGIPSFKRFQHDGIPAPY